MSASPSIGGCSTFTAAIAVLLLVAGCLRPDPAPRPSLLLVTFDTTRYDRIGANGDPSAHTPNIDALAKRGLRFEQAFASVGLTLPSHTTIMTGLEPATHGVHNNGRYRVADELETLAERLAARGYSTAAFVSASVLHRRYNLDQGFEAYGDRTDPSRGRLDFRVPSRPGSEVVDEALDWLAEVPNDTPFFVWTHFYDPHRPWRAGKLESEQPFVDDYAAEIAYTDRELGRLLDKARAMRPDEPLVVFTADHGEGLGEHDEDTHGQLVYDATLHVPLVLAGPGVPQGEVTDAYARHVDIVPTVLARLGLPGPEGLPGRDLVTTDDADAVGWFEAHGPSIDHGWAELDGVRTARWKLTAEPEPRELYDVFIDPHETDNLHDSRSAERTRMRALYDDYTERWWRSSEPLSDDALDLEQLQALAALGYIETASDTGGSPPDPRDAIRAFNWVQDARNLATAGDYDRAIAVLETLEQSESVRALVLRTLAPVAAAAGRLDQSIDAYERYIELTGGREAKLGLARVLLQADRYDDVFAALDSLEDGGGGTAALRAKALAKTGRGDEARKLLDEALAEDPEARAAARAELVMELAPFDGALDELSALRKGAPGSPHVASYLGYYMATWGDTPDAERALSLLREATEADPGNSVFASNRGWAAGKFGRIDEAIAELERSLELDPGAGLDACRLASLLADRADEKLGDKRRAHGICSRALARAPGAHWSEEARRLVTRLASEAAGNVTGRDSPAEQR